MTFAFFSRNIAIAIGMITIVAVAPLALGELRHYQVLLASLLAYGVSAVLCTLLSLLCKERFDFNLIAKRVHSYQQATAS